MLTPFPAALPIKVAIVEDERGTREMLATLLRGTPGFCCVAACESTEQALLEIPRAAPAVALVDLKLPGKSGAECIRALREKILSREQLLGKPQRTWFLVLTNFEDPENVFRAIQAGASGYLTKSTPPALILEAIRELHEGGAPMTPNIARRILHSLHEAPGTPAPGLLTTREREVLLLAGKGSTYQKIADNLGIAHGTVRKHFHNLYEKLHVHSLPEALRRAGIQ